VLEVHQVLKVQRGLEERWAYEHFSTRAP